MGRARASCLCGKRETPLPSRRIAQSNAASGRPKLRAALVCAAAFAAIALTGCVSQRSFPMRRSDWRVIPVSYAGPTAMSTRLWLRNAHRNLSKLLPSSARRALLTEDLSTGAGEPIDVDAHFGTDSKRRRSIFYNPMGLLHSAQALKDGAGDDAAWPGFCDVQIPIEDGFEISARLGVSEIDGRPEMADCIVVVPGLLGDNSLTRTRDLCRALRRAGLHTLAIEPRGYGKTLARHPEVSSTFGLLETRDLIAVADWLQRKPFVRSTGLIGFCWGANEALLTVWENGRDRDDPDVMPPLRQRAAPSSLPPRFSAGVMAFSPVLRFEEIVEQLEHRQSLLIDPVLARMGDGIKRLMIARGYSDPTRSLKSLFEREARRSKLYYPGFIEAGLRHLRFLPFRGKPVGDKLESARVPVLIVYAASDPLGAAQDLADLCCRLSNQNVAALILPGGGHNGFAAYSRSYFYSLILNFFDPNRGAAAQPLPHAVASDVSALGR